MTRLSSNQKAEQNRLADEPRDADIVFAGPGEMRALCRAHDWAATPLGSVDTWPVSLRVTVQMVMSAGSPMLVFWGPELIQIFNDHFRPSLGESVDLARALGAPGATFWAEIWQQRGPQIAHVLQGGHAIEHADVNIPMTRNGQREDVWWTYSDSPVYGDDGAIAGVLVSCHETTGRFKAEREQAAVLETLALERGRLRELFRQTPAFLALLRGPQHVVEFANDAFYQLVGHRELIGKPVFDALPDARDQGFEALLDGVSTSGEAFVGRSVPVRLARTPGAPLEERLMDLTYAPLTAEDDASPGIIVLGVDVTDQVRAREQLAAAEQQLRTFADAIPTLAWTSRADGYVDWYNARWYEYTGTTPEQMQGWGWTAVNDPEVLPSVMERWRASVASGDPFEMTFPLRDAHGQFQSFLARVVPFRDGAGNVVRWFGTATNIESEQRLRRAAEEANRAKSEFLTIMSHELRTPLNAIEGYTELIELGIRGPVTEEQRHDLSRIRKSQKHLLGLINGVLNYAQVEAGAVHYEIESVPLESVLIACEALTEPQAQRQGVVLRRHPCDSELTVRADREKLQQVVLNLLSNAIKFTSAGGSIDLRCEVQRSEDQTFVHIRIADTGIGIGPAHLARVFEPFVQVDSELTRIREGTGLGLAISRDLARAMGGDVTVASTLGVGSTFTLTLRAA